MTKAERGGSRRVQWQARLRRFERSGHTVAEFCKAESISAWSLYDWRRKLGGGGRIRRAAPAQGAAFVDAGAVEVVAAADRGAGPTVTLATGLELRIELGGGIVLQIRRR